jgi:hypothetical protein
LSDWEALNLTIRVIDYANREFRLVGGSVSMEKACPAPILPVFRRNGLHLSRIVSAEWGKCLVIQGIFASQWEE